MVHSYIAGSHDYLGVGEGTGILTMGAHYKWAGLRLMRAVKATEPITRDRIRRAVESKRRYLLEHLVHISTESSPQPSHASPSSNCPCAS